MSRFTLVLGIALVLSTVAGAQPATTGSLAKWSFDELTLANGAKFEGLILSESTQGIRFQSVSQPPGRPTVTLTSFFTKAEIAAVKRLSEPDRAVLKERLAELDPSGAGERRRMESLELVMDNWPGKPGAAKRYESDYFMLLSSGSDELTRRSAVRLEQIYAAFARFLPPTVRDGRPTLIMLATDDEEYKALLGPLGKADLLNPAVYDPAGNRILCGTDLKRLGTELQAARLHHSQQLETLKKYETELSRLYKQPELQRYLNASAAERKRIHKAEAANGEKFDQATARVFAVLYHEAFHAYVGTFVYKPRSPAEVKDGKGTGELPRWLNEGLAQVFETAVVEAGELRADAPDGVRLERIKQKLRKKNGQMLVSLTTLLSTGKETFLTSHQEQKGGAERAYESSWAMAYYLTFERRAIGSPAFKKYLVAINSGAEATSAFAELVGQDLPTFEKDWHAYLLRLQKDGTVAK